MLALVLSLVMVFGLVGCGKDAGGSDNDGSTKLTVWYWGEQEIPGYKQYMEEMAQKYSSETDGISVEVVLQESDTLYSALRTAEQAGEGPDLAFLWGGTQALDDAWLGNLAPISDYMTEEELSCMTASAETMDFSPPMESTSGAYAPSPSRATALSPSPTSTP